VEISNVNSIVTRPTTINTAVTPGWAELRRLNVVASPHSQSQNLSHTLGDYIATVYFRPQLPPELQFDADRELTLESTPTATAEAEAAFHQAIEIACSQTAKLYELRATVSLARLLHTNRREEARAMLTDIYNWFTEGFDTADLKDAKALLDQLNRSQ
jgi:hypothetical protein